MSKEEANKENTESQASEEEQPEKERSEIGSPEEGISRFLEKKAEEEEASKETGEKPEDKNEEPCEECRATDEDLEIEEEEAKLWYIDKEGKKTPCIFKADGKGYTPDDPAWVNKQASLGVHSNVKTEEVNKKLSEFEQIKPFFDVLDKAVKEGRLMIDGKRITSTSIDTEIEAEAEEEEEDEELESPKVKKLEKEVKDLKELKLREIITQYKDKMLDEVEKVRPENYLAFTRMYEDPEDGIQPLNIWDLLQKNKNMTPEEAMEKSHNSQLSFFFDPKNIERTIEKYPEKALFFVEKVIDKSPEGFKKVKNRIITDYLDGKGEREEAPVGAPSGAIEGKVKPEERKFEDAADAARQFFEKKEAEEAAGRKS